MDNKQAILGFTEFFKGITGNQNLEIPSEIAEKCGIQAQADGDLTTALCSLPKIISEDGQDYVQLADVLETVKRALEQETKAEKVIKMRDATPEEQEAIDKYIKSISKPTGVNFGSLEQEPCEDAISRQAVQTELENCEIVNVHDENDNFIGYYNADTVDSIVRNLPPVNPQPKTGHWIIIDDCEKFIAKCSECGQIEDSRMIGKYAYCHCGAKMVEPQESEVNNG